MLLQALLLFHQQHVACQGCCCCQGLCVFQDCTPCPCPAPAPGLKPPKCQLQNAFDAFEAKYANVASTAANLYPSKTTLSAGQHNWTYSTGWTSGFYPGLLWSLANYSATSNKPLSQKFKDAALASTAGRKVEESDTSTHDVGFMVFDSFGLGVELGGEGKDYEDVIVKAAHSLSVRWNPTVGMIRSWGRLSDESQFEVIIDNLMNLELIFWAAAKTGNSTLFDIAVAHAKKTGELWLRPDNSTVHLCVFDPKSGKLAKPCTGTPQGFSPSSTWARGQAWGIYGFTMAYRYSKNVEFLGYANRAASFYMENTDPHTKVPYWDFDAPKDQLYPDTSSAAITASALIELQAYTGDGSLLQYARGILQGLFTNFVADSSSEAVFFGNQHDCGDAKCTIIETEFYAFEAMKRLLSVAS